MSSGLYTHTTRAVGLTLTANIYNTDHTNHISNHIPTKMDDYSTDLSQMQETLDPYASDTAVQPAKLSEELKALRYMIRQVTGGAQWYIDSNEIPNRNYLINGGMEVVQRGTSFTSATTPVNSDDTYLLDRWLLLSDGNDIVDVTQQTGGGVSGNEAYIRLDVETVSKKFGILQVIENKNLKSVIGGKVSLSFEAKVTNASKLTDIRAVVVAWDGTADTVTSDIVSAWNAEGTRPTLVANWTAENTDSDLGVTASWVRYEIQNISLDTASMTNIGVFIYQNDVATNDTTGIFLELTNIQVVKGAIATRFVGEEIGTDLNRCKRYYERLNSAGRNLYSYGIGQCNSTSQAVFIIQYEVEKRVVPTITDSAAGDFIVTQAISSVEDVNIFTFDQITVSTVRGLITTSGNLAAGNATRIGDDGGGNSYIEIDAELQ